MPTKVTAHKCDFCGRCFTKRSNAARHESSCKGNPILKRCKTCIHGMLGVVGIRPCPFDYDEPMDEYGAVCNYHEEPMSKKPWERECEYDDPGTGEPARAIGGTCKHYEYKGKAEWTKEEE